MTRKIHQALKFAPCMPVLDDIWHGVPADRPFDERVVRFALEVAGTAGRVLDLGCGDGRLAARLAEAGADVAGIDPSTEALERARQAHPGLQLVPPEPDGRLPFADNSFDAVVCVNVLEHVADTQSLMSEARRVLVPGGRLAVAVPWHGRLKSALIALTSFERHHDPLQPVLRFYTARSLTRLSREFGFDQVRVRASGGLPLNRETLLAQARRGSLAA
jgi:SAM-dependent methyltransferase